MGTIAEKLAYLNDTKTALRKAINDAGGYLTVDDTFRSYAGEWLREKSATLSIDFWCERFITRRQGSLAPFAIGSGIVNFTRSTVGGRFNEYGLYVTAAIDAWRSDHDPASLTTSSSTASFDSSVASFELPSGHAFFVGDLFRATAIAGSVWGVVMARSATSVVVHVRNSNATGSASSWTCIKPLGLLIEEARTNLLLQSGNPETAIWTLESVSLGVAISGPSGKETPVYETGSSAFFRLRPQAISVAAGVSYTYTFTIKKLGRRYLYIRTQARTMANENIGFDLDIIATTFVPSGWTASISKVSSDIYKITATCTASSSNSIIHGVLPSSTPITSNSLSTYLGDPTQGFIYISGQLEAGAFPTSYIPTEASQVTRAADVASVNTLSPWYNASEGTLYFEGSSFGLGSSSTSYGVALTDGTGNEVIAIRRNATGFGAAIIDGGVTQASFAPAYTNALLTKIALAYKANDFAISKDGATPLTDSSGTIPTVDRLNIGSTGTGTSFNNGHIRSLRYWSRRDMPIQEMTA